MRYILLLLLVGCNSWTMGVIGSDEHTSGYQQKSSDNHCITDDQCGEGFVCVKLTDGYVGLCGKVVNDDKVKEERGEGR